MMNNLKPIYLLAGGRSSNREPLCSLIQIIFKENGVTSPTVAYVGTANGDDESFFQRMADILRTAGAGKVNHALISSYGADLRKARDVLTSADIVLVSGGDVFEGIQKLKERNMVDFLRRLYDQGKPFFGLSAGSIMLAENWVHWSDPNDDSTAELFPCLQFAPIICDTHGEQDDWEELKMALKLSKDDQKGYGIVSGTAIRVYPNSRMVEALGGAINQFIRHEGRIIRLSDILPTV
jgi:dipeptidase E